MHHRSAKACLCTTMMMTGRIDGGGERMWWHGRKQIRLRGWDYRNAGAYFVTICSHQQRCQFGEVVNGQMRLNAWGQIVVKRWREIPEHYPMVMLDGFICMPNHVHMIVWIDFDAQGGVPAGLVGQWHAIALQDQPRKHGTDAGSLGAVIGSFKGAVTQEVNQMRGESYPPVWQGRFYDRIIRNERELWAVREYIKNNPRNWTADQNWEAGLDDWLDGGC